jgi:superoxide reductase
MSYKRDDMYGCGGANQCDCLAEMVRDCAGDCVLSCCESPMKKIEAKTQDAGQEKHVPVIEKIDGGFKVTIGSVPHPMEEDHFIQFIELRADGELQRKYLKPGVAPEAVFKTEAAEVGALEFCNKHGLWADK